MSDQYEVVVETPNGEYVIQVCECCITRTLEWYEAIKWPTDVFPVLDVVTDHTCLD